MAVNESTEELAEELGGSSGNSGNSGGIPGTPYLILLILKKAAPPVTSRLKRLCFRECKTRGLSSDFSR